jgi:phage gpG-like protein
VKLEIHIDGEKQVIELTKEMARRAKDMRPVMDQIGMYMTRSVLKTFQAGGRPKWPASIRAMRESGKTLTLSGRLRSSSAASTRSPAGVCSGRRIERTRQALS